MHTAKKWRINLAKGWNTPGNYGIRQILTKGLPVEKAVECVNKWLNNQPNLLLC
jgi:hypothetical protein